MLRRSGHNFFAIASLSRRNPLESLSVIALRSLCNRFAIALQSRFAMDLLCNRFEIALDLLYNRNLQLLNAAVSEPIRDHFAIAL
jgi:hypothetical protein